MEINKNLLEMGKRVFNNKMETVEKDGKIVASDEGALKKLINSAYNENCSIKNYQAVHDLNQLIVTTAETLVTPDLKKTIGLVSEYKTVGANDIMEYDINDRLVKTTMALSATGTGVDFQKIPSYKKKQLATPKKHQFGVKYSISKMLADGINEFKNAVTYVQEEKIRYIMSQIYVLTRGAVSTAKIPSRQILDASNFAISDYRKVEASLLRYGNNVKPVLIADPLFIGTLAERQATTVIAGTALAQYMTDETREKLFNSNTIEQISRTIAINIDNPYTDRMNSQVYLPVNEGIMVAGGNLSPFKVTEFGSLAVLEDNVTNHIETEEAFIKISYKVDITLLLNRAVAYLKDDSIVL